MGTFYAQKRVWGRNKNPQFLLAVADTKFMLPNRFPPPAALEHQRVKELKHDAKADKENTPPGKCNSTSSSTTGSTASFGAGGYEAHFVKVKEAEAARLKKPSPSPGRLMSMGNVKAHANNSSAGRRLSAGGASAGLESLGAVAVSFRGS